MKNLAKLIILASFTAWWFPISRATLAQQEEQTTLCTSVYTDTNTNGILDDGEGLVAEAYVQVFDSTGKRVAWYTTDGLTEPNCTPIKGDETYRVEITPPLGFKPTTRTDWEFEVPPNYEVELEFGVQYAPTQDVSPYEAEQTQTIIILIGIVIALLAIGFVAGYIVGRRRRPAG